MTFPTEPICLITGVTLFNEDEGRAYPADLFIFGDRFIVNASGEGEVRLIRDSERVISFSQIDAYFERRNVYIFPVASYLLNDAAKAYIKEAPHAPRF